MKDRFDIDEFLELKRRWEAFRFTHGRKPNYVTDRAGGKIPRDVFNDMVIRYERFVASTGREPSFVRVKADTVSDEWTTTGYFKADFQDTDHLLWSGLAPCSSFPLQRSTYYRRCELWWIK